MSKKIQVCMGSACHLKGSYEIINILSFKRRAADCAGVSGGTGKTAEIRRCAI